MRRSLVLALALAVLLAGCGRYGRPVRPRPEAAVPAASAQLPQPSDTAPGVEPRDDEEE